MPQVFVAIGVALGGTVGAALIMYAPFLASASLLIGSVALTSAQASRAKRKAREQYNASQVDRLANVPGTVVPRELVLGRVRKGGHVFFRGSVGANKEKFVMLVVLAGHEIDGVEQIWLNDVPVTLDGSGYVQTAPYLLSRRESGSVAGAVAPPEAIPGTIFTSTDGGEVSSGTTTTYQYIVNTPKARIRAYLGAPGQAADAQVIADFPSLWTAAHRADGIAYLVCEFGYDETAFPSSLPMVTATLRGARCFDPRTGLTAFTENPAIQQRHVLTHPYFGKRSTLSADEDARIVAAANACDVGYNYGQGHVPMYRASIVLPFGGAARDGLDDLAQAMAGQWAYAAGEFFTRAGVYTAPVISLTEADLAVVRRGGDGGANQQSIGISTHRARAEKFNVITPRIFDIAQNYKQVPVAPVRAAALIARDGAELVQEVDMPAVFSAQQAQHVAGVAMRDSRDPLTVTLPFKLAAYRAELFDTVSLTIPRYGWAGKTFMVVQRQWTLEGLIQLTLKETAAEIYQPDATFVASGYAQNTAFTRPWDIQPPANLDAFSGSDQLIVQADGTLVTRVRVTWEALTDQTVERIEVQWAVPAETLTWQTITTGPVEVQTFITGVPPDGGHIIIRARTRNSLAASDWSLQIVHAVLGKLAPPANVQAVTVSGDSVAFTPVDEPDLAGYLVRFQYGNNTWWDSAGPLHDGIVTESPYQLQRQPVGLCTVMVKALDTSGNVSREPAFVYHVFPEQVVGNVVATFAQAPTFPGSISNGSLVSSTLQAASLDDFYEPADGPMYLPSAEAMYLASQYAPLSYEFTVAASQAGTLTLLTDITGAYTLEYQTGGAEPMFGPVTGDPLYLPVDEPIYGVPTAWQLWPGSLDLDGAIEVRFRVTLAAGETQGVITTVTAQLDVPDVSERLAAVAIGSGGTRLPIVRDYNVITVVNLTVYSGGTGAGARIIDKDAALGPLVQIINTSGTAVAGTLDAVIQGY